MSENRGVPTYILRRPACGHIVAAQVDDSTTPRRDVARFLAGGARAGLVAERVTVGYVRDLPVGEWCPATCPHRPAKRRRAAPPERVQGTQEESA